MYLKYKSSSTYGIRYAGFLQYLEDLLRRVKLHRVDDDESEGVAVLGYVPADGGTRLVDTGRLADIRGRGSGTVGRGVRTVGRGPRIRGKF